ncbi:hypothetical protein FAK_18210 [Desulfoferula mesophila]|uniref:Uncharacterized protein n=1 Tax=Desulfoferula mesophila TaxID=3058419 RepID=A0AAU9ESM2_9BACT|nr:hypothetical protein FAK_18210 [Desulfoferula mesophilus]
MALIIKVKGYTHGSTAALAGLESLDHQIVPLLTLHLPSAGMPPPKPPSIIPATRHPESLTLDANAVFAYIVMH